MPQGTLEVLLVGAKGLENTDFLCNMDPYVILTCRTQEQKSSVASGKGSEPEWNETFVFNLSEGISELSLKILDSDNGTADDFVGEARRECKKETNVSNWVDDCCSIPLEPLFMAGDLPPTSYNVVKEQEFRGEIRIGLKFTPDSDCDREFQVSEESYGGWKESSY
ncbi:hypothetical protein Sjap_020611 [Stephania japonica]|uniref:C2 domain-containing protein n=1 Tax=Stephania japonica TaxID=461633 RepID=A0AAP0F3S7_9MAGN